MTLTLPELLAGAVPPQPRDLCRGLSLTCSSGQGDHDFRPQVRRRLAREIPRLVNHLSRLPLGVLHGPGQARCHLRILTLDPEPQHGQAHLIGHQGCPGNPQRERLSCNHRTAAYDRGE